MRRREAEGGIASRSEIRKSVSGDAERGMMVKATPTSTFVMAQAEFTFELFVISFDAPAQFGIIDECGEGRVLGQGRKPVFCGSRLSLRPFDEQPFDRMRCGSLVVPRGEVRANGGEAGSKRRVRSLPPGNAAPCLFA